jgi:hypothetical protein
MPKALMLAFSEATTPEVDAEYNQWYSEKHIFDLLGIEGFVSATRYRLVKGVETLPGIEGDPHTHLAIYEIEGETAADVQKFADSLKVALSDGTADISPHINMENITATFCIPITERVAREQEAAV